MEIDADLSKLTSEKIHLMSLINPASTYMVTAILLRKAWLILIYFLLSVIWHASFLFIIIMITTVVV